MYLSTRLANDFENGVRKRGESYFARGLVRIQQGSESHVEANVHGSRVYEVSLEYEDGELSSWCDCAYFDSAGECKHLWATVLAADAKGYLSAAAADPRVSLYDAPAPVPVPPKPPPPPPMPVWRKRLGEIAKKRGDERGHATAWPAKRQILYAVETRDSIIASSLVLSLLTRERKADGTFSGRGYLSLKRFQIPDLPVAEDRQILSALAGGGERYSWSGTDYYSAVNSRCQLNGPLAGIVIPQAVRTGRCVLLKGNAAAEDLTPITWDEGAPWGFTLEMRREKQGWVLAGVLRRAAPEGEERMELTEADLVTEGGFVFARGRVAPLAADAPFEWVDYLRRTGSINAPEEAAEELLAALFSSPSLPPVEVPEELRFEELTPAPRPFLRISAGEQIDARPARLRAELAFNYDGRLVPEIEPARGFYDAAARRLLRRDALAERAAIDALSELGLKFRNETWNKDPAWEIAPTKLPRIVHALVDAGWQIEAEGKVFRRPGAFRMEVASGVDWFELHGEVEYGDTSAKLPDLLEALRKGENMVRLGDGTYGVLPEEWLRRFGMLAGLGTREADHVRFRTTQAGLLDALLASQPEMRCDETFTRVRDELRAFQGIEAAEQPAGFVGRLRDYQREGLGWLHFLRRFGFGGCLADDMGVGKTAQVLALLETRRELRAAGELGKPSMVVVPRSLVFNWKEEATRFTPQLRVLDYTGQARDSAEFAAYDVILTTYGIMRRDALRLRNFEFDYVILDEAQAIKNAGAESAKPSRLLNEAHRLAMIGTPIENHLGELWSLFEFLNPGMLGTAKVFDMAGGADRRPSEDARRVLAQALRPFILRRTKDQVARELPAKTEQTIYCEMEPAQRKLYNELRQHYRMGLLKRIESEGMGRSKILVIEALLRLRQAACHPGLLDPKRVGESSAKLDTLTEQLREVLAEGHKALVFSQFTSLLAIVRARLDKDGVVYEYLDGQTRDRQERVERFQNDPECPVFLISLKAGGLGLNLTAAGYVFLLDPWWNPAVEAQAVDRAHRIGQTKQVFAYRLIARDTVEEKVLELQKTKRDLAAAIIGEDNSLIRDLGREDLELLLS